MWLCDIESHSRSLYWSLWWSLCLCVGLRVFVLVYCVIMLHLKPFQVFVLVFVVVFVSLCWSLCLCVGLLCDCVTAKAIPGLLTFSHFCRRRYSWRLTIIRTKATSVTTIEIEKPYSVKLKLPNCQIALFSLPIAIHCQIAFAKFLYCLYCLELNLPIMERGFPALCVSFCAAIVPTIIHPQRLYCLLLNWKNNK